MNAVINVPSEIAVPKDMAGRVTARDWQRLSNDLDAQGCAVIDGLLTQEECDAMTGLYKVDEMFRSRVVMELYGFGRGEYKYFTYPLPDIIAGLRTSIYPYLVPVANRLERRNGHRCAFSGGACRFHRALPCCRPASADAAAVAVCDRRLQLLTSRPVW